MNRQIKFRTWSLENKKMSEPFDMDDIANTFDCGFFVEHYFDSAEFNPLNETEIMQSTGITDKNGKDVYESDLLLTDDMYHDYQDGVAINALPDGKIVEVVFRDGAFFAGDELLCEVASAWEIVGNRYENPDLLTR